MRQRGSIVEYIILSLCLCLGALSTALASPLYPMYVLDWQISTTQIGYAFIAYMFGVVFSLLFFNSWTIRFGYKKVIICGLLMSIIALIYSALAQDIWNLSGARFLIGISSGLLSTSTIVGLSQKYPFKNKLNAGKISSILTVFGFGLGPLIGGIIADHSTAPLTTPYLVVAAISTLVLIACPLIKYNHATSEIIVKTKIWNTPVKLCAKHIFFPCSITALCCFAVFSLYAALAGNFIAELPLTQSATLTGISISAILFISTFIQLAFKGLKESTSLQIGLILTTGGCISLLMAQYTHSIIWLVASILCVGIGHGLSLSPAYYFVGKIAQQENNAIFSTFLLIGYQGTIWPVLLSSILIDHYGVISSLAVFSTLILLTVIWLFTQIRHIKNAAV